MKTAPFLKQQEVAYILNSFSDGQTINLLHFLICSVWLIPIPYQRKLNYFYELLKLANSNQPRKACSVNDNQLRYLINILLERS